MFFFFKQKTAYEMRISDWSSDVCSSDLRKNPNPTDTDIETAITNICRCGTYPRIREAVKRAGRIMRREARIAAAPPRAISPQEVARARSEESHAGTECASMCSPCVSTKHLHNQHHIITTIPILKNIN